MEISANAKAILSVVVAVLGLVASGTVAFPDSVPVNVQHEIVQWDSFSLAIFAAINAVLHIMPDTPKAGGGK